MANTVAKTDLYVIILCADVVNANIPFLIRLDFLDKYGFFVKNTKNLLCSEKLDIQIPLTRKRGHIYLPWKCEEIILFIKSELIKMHRCFSHSSSDKLYNLLKTARPWETNLSVDDMLNAISKSCKTCQRFNTPPIRLKFSLPNEDLVLVTSYP